MIPRIAVLMTVHNRKDKTLRCLGLLQAQTGLEGRVDVDVWMTDDGCTDGTAEAVRERFPYVNIVHGDGSLYWNRGTYAAWSAAEEGGDYDFWFWLNDDTDLVEDALVRLLDSSQGHGDKAIIVGSTCSSTDPSVITYGGWTDKSGLIKDVSSEVPCDTIGGNIILIPRYVYEILGKNERSYHHALGDRDYGYRAGRAGIEIFIGKGFFGVCDRHERPAKWKDSQMPLKVRWKDFFSPYGSTGMEFFRFRRRFCGFLPAVKTLVTSFFHMLLPSLYDRFFPEGANGAGL
ncbi:MAG: glycosyltransferase family 2 protein [Bacteroidales bacterium]|nr:glycosyltransferase family 2 protein [Bacteroidales bacterium]